MKETPSSDFLEFYSCLTSGNKLVSIEVSVCYHRHMLQQAGYKEVPYSLSQEHYL
jgi:hypothetical protein